jgi:hypothetical protein
VAVGVAVWNGGGGGQAKEERVVSGQAEGCEGEQGHAACGVPHAACRMQANGCGRCLRQGAGGKAGRLKVGRWGGEGGCGKVGFQVGVWEGLAFATVGEMRKTARGSRKDSASDSAAASDSASASASASDPGAVFLQSVVTGSFSDKVPQAFRGVCRQHPGRRIYKMDFPHKTVL